MNFCPKCGGQLNGEAQFCPYCGAVVSAPSPQPQTSEYGHGMPQASPAVRVVKALGSSPLYLVAIIAFSLTALLTLISAFASPMNIVNAIIGAIDQYAELGAYELMEIYDAIEEYLGVITTVNVISTIFRLIPTLIIVLGLWLIFAASRKPDYERFSTAGFTTIKVMNVISLVCSCISSLFFLIIMIIGTVAGAASDVDGLAAVFGIGIVITIVVAVVIIVYYCKIIKCLNVATRSVIDNIPYPQASRFVGILCFIGAFGALLGLFTFSILSLLSAICNVAQMICFGILIFKYRSSMTQAAYTAMPQYEQYPQNQAY